MSLEKDIQDLVQSVNLLTKAIDLNTAVLADNNSAVLEMLNRSNGSPNVVMNVSKEAADAAIKERAEAEVKTKASAKQAETEQEPLTDAQIKETQLYADLQDLMGELVKASEKAGMTNAEAKADAIKFLKTFSDDGKVLSLSRALFETGDPGEAQKVMVAFSAQIEKLNADSAEAGDPGDFGGDYEETTYTDEDVKTALRKYAAVEGRPAAVAKLKELTGGKSAVKDIPADQYAAVIAGLKI